MVTKPDHKPRLRQPLALIATLCALLSGCSIGCWFVPSEHTTYVRTIVSDDSGAPIAGAQVKIYGFSAETDRVGCIMLPVHSSQIALHVEATGYKPLEQSLPVSVRAIAVTLQPSNAAAASSAVAGDTHHYLTSRTGC